MATPNYDIDREGVKAATDAEMKTAVTEMEKGYDSIIAENKATEKGMLDKIEANKNQQIANANQQTEFAIDKIEQQKAQAQKDYTKEQSGAYVDWQKQSNQYGANAEQRAANGLTNTGYAESSQVAMYNQWQNRVAVAREAFTRANLDYDNLMAEARLQNSSVLAEIAAAALEKSLQITLSFAQQNNTLLTEKVKQKQAIQDSYYQRYLAELDSIIKENTLKEQVRQFNADLDFKERQFAWQKEQAAKSSSGGGKISGKGSSGGSEGGSLKDYKLDPITGRVIPNKTTSSKEEEPTVNQASLERALSRLGKSHTVSAETIDSLIREGKLVEYEKGGQLYYKVAPFNGAGLNYTNATKGDLPTSAGLYNTTGLTSDKKKKSQAEVGPASKWLEVFK